MTSSRLPIAFKVMLRHAHPAVDEAIADALPTMSKTAQAEALAALVVRGHGPSLARVVSYFHDAGDSLRASILHHAGDLTPGLRTAMTSGNFEQRASAIELIVCTERYDLVYLLAGALRSSNSQTHELSAAAIRILAEPVLNQDDVGLRKDTTQFDDRQRMILDALARVIESWEFHRQQTLLQVAAWFDDLMINSFKAKLEAPHSELIQPMCDLIERCDDTRVAPFVLRCLTIQPLRASAAKRITMLKDEEFIGAVLSCAHMLDDPDFHRACKWIRGSTWLHDDLDSLLALDEERLIAAVRFFFASGVSSARRYRVLGELLSEDRPRVRQEIVRQLFREKGESATEMLRTVAFRFRDDSSRLAERELRRREKSLRGASDTQVFEPSGSGFADRFESFWREFDGGRTEQTTSFLQTLRARRNDSLSQIRTKMASHSFFDRARAIELAQMVGLTKELESQIYRLVHDSDSFVRSLALSALAEIPGPTSSRILRMAVSDPDERVQANAIEALNQVDDPARVRVTVPKLQSANCRVRANAVRSLLRADVPLAAEALIDMLEHSSRAQRLSGLWVARSLDLRSVFPRVMAMANNDSDPRVREKAIEVLDSAVGSIRRGGAGQPGLFPKEPVQGAPSGGLR